MTLARERLKFDAERWQTVRVGFVGDEITAQVAGAETRARFIGFEGEIGLRGLVAVGR